MVIVISLTLFMLLLSVGLYLVFRKKPGLTDQKVQIQKWLEKFPESARAVHLKELNKQTEKIWTKAWFLAYWRGERSAFYAFMTWIFAINSLLKFLMFIITFGLAFILSYNTFDWLIYLHTMNTIIFLGYSLFATVIWWRCSRNSRPNITLLIRTVIIVSIGLGIFQLSLY